MLLQMINKNAIIFYQRNMSKHISLSIKRGMPPTVSALDKLFLSHQAFIQALFYSR